LTLQEIKKDFKESCENLFNQTEINQFWKWFEENLVNIADENDRSKQYQFWIDELLSGKPIQYIFGYAFFHRYQYFTDSKTLIPRPETEELCELILNSNKGTQQIKGIDIGTGTGCIPLTLLNERKEWKFDAWDISAGALEVASKNAEKYALTDRIHFSNINFLNNDFQENDYDIIVSNPPYISKDELKDIDQRVIAFEPHLALFVNDHAMEFYEALYHFFESNTNENAQLWMETHQDYCEDVLRIFSQKFSSKKIEDFSQNPRFVCVTKSKLLF
jgi:release factor glutamine methyltransferase